MTDLRLQYQLATKYYNKGYITKERLEGFKMTGNKGILAECRLAEILNIKNYQFDNREGADVNYRGLKIQFKFNGKGSSSSATEITRKPSQSLEQHATEVLNHYKEITEFWIVTTNNLQFNKEDIHYYNHKEFKQLLLNHQCKINLKIRLKKGIIEQFNKENY